MRVSLERRRHVLEEELTRETNSSVTPQSPLRRCSMATSSMTASPLPSSRRTRRSKSSPTMRVSELRCSKRRRFTRPVEMICEASILRTRVMGMNTRFLPSTSTMMPTTMGSLPLAGRAPAMDAPRPRLSTTTSRRRPRRSPKGSKTSRPRRRAM